MEMITEQRKFIDIAKSMFNYDIVSMSEGTDGELIVVVNWNDFNIGLHTCQLSELILEGDFLYFSNVKKIDRDMKLIVDYIDDNGDGTYSIVMTNDYVEAILLDDSKLVHFNIYENVGEIESFIYVPTIIMSVPFVENPNTTQYTISHLEFPIIAFINCSDISELHINNHLIERALVVMFKRTIATEYVCKGSDSITTDIAIVGSDFASTFMGSLALN